MKIKRGLELPFTHGTVVVELTARRKGKMEADARVHLGHHFDEYFGTCVEAASSLATHLNTKVVSATRVEERMYDISLSTTDDGWTLTTSIAVTTDGELSQHLVHEALSRCVTSVHRTVVDAFLGTQGSQTISFGIIVEDGAALFDLAGDLGRDTVTQMLATMSGGRKLRDIVTEVFDARRSFPLGDLFGNGATAMRDRFTRRETERHQGDGVHTNGMRSRRRLDTDLFPRRPETEVRLSDETFEDIAVLHGLTSEQLKGVILGAAFKRKEGHLIDEARARHQVEDITALTGPQTRELIEQCGDTFTEQLEAFRSGQSRRDFETETPFKSMTKLYQGFGFTDASEFTTTVIALALMNHGGEFVSEFLERNKVHPRQMNASVLSHLIEEAQIGTLLHDVAALVQGRKFASA
jgi:hypothetical protein